MKGHLALVSSCMLLLLVAAATSAAALHVPTLLPSVRSLQRLDGAALRLGNRSANICNITVTAAIRGARNTDDELRLKTFFESFFARVPAVPVELRVAATMNFGGARDAHGFIGGNDAYTLVATAADGIVISSPSVTGLMHGSKTAKQLLLKASESDSEVGQDLLPPLRIVDAPVSSYRGLMIDNVRNAHNFTFHLDFLERLAEQKLNVYHIHSSDDQGYSMPSSAYPKLPMPSAMTLAEAQALQAKAVSLGVHIVAEIDLPGHSSALLKAIPALAAINKKTGKPCSNIDLESPAALKILQTLLGEVMDLFPTTPWHHLGADEISYNPDCGTTKQTYHAFINTMNAFVQGRNKTMIVWGGFDPNPPDADVIDKNVVVSPFDSVREIPWLHRPHHYYDAGYNLINTDWNPLYLVHGDSGFAAGPEALAGWDPTKYGSYPNLGNSRSNWQSLPKDNWNDPSYRSGFTNQTNACWPDTSQHGAGYIPQPYPATRLLGGALCSWSNPQAAEVPMFFGSCFGDGARFQDLGLSGPGWPRPSPRAAIIAERLWSGAAATSQDILERVDCAYWAVPPPPTPSPAPTPAGSFTPGHGACRDGWGRIPYARLDHSGPVSFQACRSKCESLGERCDAFDVDGPPGCGAQGQCGWCGVWGNLTISDTDGKFVYTKGYGERACHAVPSAGNSNTCYTRPPECTKRAERGEE